MPFFAGKPLAYAATRLDVGGKMITNYMGELISFREINVMGEAVLLNEIKENLGYISEDFQKDLNTVKELGKRQYD